MASKVEFFIQNPNDFVTYFDEVYEIFPVTSTGAKRTLFLTDNNHPSCMKVSAVATNQGVYKEVSVGGSERHVVEFAYMCSGGQQIRARIQDHTNTTTLHQVTLGGANWANFYKRVTTPASCRILRIDLLKASTVAKAFYIDDVRIQGNMLYADPDDYGIELKDSTQDHQTADGGKTTDRLGQNAIFSFRYPTITASVFSRLRNGAKGGLATYFDDGNVPVVTEAFVIRATASKTFNGVTQGMTDKAYYTATSATPNTATNFQAASFSNTRYANIGQEGSTMATNPITGTGDYGYHKFVFKTTVYASKLHIKKFAVKYQGLAVDASPNGVQGVNLYAWNGTAWVLVGRSRTSDKQTIAFDTTRKEQAQQFVDVASGYIRILAQTRATKDTGGTLNLKTYYIEAKVNEDEGYSKTLHNKAILSASGGIVSAKNLTSGSSLVLNRATTGYRIGDDRKKIYITSDEVSGSYIQVKYNQYYNVAIRTLKQPTIFKGNIANPRSSAELVIETLTPVAKV